MSLGKKEMNSSLVLHRLCQQVVQLVKGNFLWWGKSKHGNGLLGYKNDFQIYPSFILRETYQTILTVKTF